MALLEVKNIKKSFGKVEVLKGISFELEKGEVLAIIGSSGSGKTTFTDTIVETFSEHVTVIHHDNYYKVQDHLTYEERCKTNYDHPDSFDTALMIEHIKALKNGESVDEPVYDYTVHNRDKSKTITLEPTKILIIDGILVLENKELCDKYGIKKVPSLIVKTHNGVEIFDNVSDIKKYIEENK